MKRGKVLLYNPRAEGHVLPLALVHIGSMVPEFDVRILDGRIELTPEATLADNADNAICLGVTVLTGKPILDALRASRAAKRRNPRLPVIWGPSYASGVAVSGEIGRFTYAAEVKNAALASQPASWDFDRGLIEHPTMSARLGYRPNLMWNFGLSASSGPYLRPAAEATIPAAHARRDYRQVVIGQDVSFAWHYWQVWLEACQARFENPRIGDAVTNACYAEVKYKFTPQFSGALRWNLQTYGDITHQGGRRPWGRDTWRVDVAPSYRFTPHFQLKLQYSYQEEAGAARPVRHTLATQATLRF